MLRDQKGFSLIELMVVVAILAVVGIGGMLSLSFATRQDAESCAAQIESYIGQTKNYALSREAASLTIFTQSDGVYINPSVTGQDKKIGKYGMTVSYKTDSNIEVTLSDTTRLKISFDRSSGAFITKAVSGGTESDVICKEITLVGGGKTVRIILIPATGKYYIEE